MIPASDDGIVIGGSGKENDLGSYLAGRVRRPARRGIMTVEEYLQTPETLRPQELIYGALRVADAPLPRHQLSAVCFARSMIT